VDLRDYTGMIEHQLRLNACTANATASACEMFLIANGVFADTPATDSHDLSRLFNYYTSRQSLGGVFADRDIGSTARESLRVARNLGLCFERTWPYDESMVNVRPSDAAYVEALNWRIGSYERINMVKAITFESLNPEAQIRYAIAKGWPVQVGMRIGQRFLELKPDEVYSYVHPVNNPFIINHEMLIVSYDSDRDDVTIENSLGPDWCDRGYFRCPMRVLVNDAIDLWVVKGFAGYERVGPDVTITVPADPNETLVINAYRDMLHRPPEPAGLAHWMSLLAAGMTHADMRRHIANQSEFQNAHTTVESLYRDILLRPSDPDGLAAWTASGLTIAQIIPGFLGSAEFFAKFG